MVKRKKMIMRLRRDGFPNGHIGRDSSDNIVIAYNKIHNYEWQAIVCTQTDARLIAKRINQFLDAGG